MNTYWLKLGIGLFLVSVPFLILAFQKKIPWIFFFSWTFTSVFSTLTFLLVQNAIEKNLNEKTKLIISIALGLMFVALGSYMKKIQSENVKKMSWLFIVFGAAWIVLSIR